MDQELNCFQQGHESNTVSYICLDEDCDSKRSYCEFCLQLKAHKHEKEKKPIKIIDFLGNLDEKQNHINDDLQRLEEMKKKYKKLLDFFTTIIQEIQVIIEEEIEGLQYHLKKINKAREAILRRIKDEFLISKQFQRTINYQTDKQFFSVLNKNQQESLREITKMYEFFDQSRQKSLQLSIRNIQENIDQQSHKFYSHTIINDVIESVNVVQKTIPKGIHFFIKKNDQTIRFYRKQTGNNTYFDDGQIFDISVLKKLKKISGVYEITDDGKFIINYREQGQINIFNFKFQQPSFYKKFRLTCNRIWQIIFCEDRYLITLDDSQTINLINIESEQLFKIEQKFISGELQYIQQLSLLVIPVKTTLIFQQIQLGEKISISEIFLETERAFSQINNNNKNIYKLTSDLSLLATSSFKSLQIKVFYTDLKMKIVHFQFKIQVDHFTYDLYWNFNDTSIIQISKSKKYTIIYLNMQKKECFTKSFNNLFQEEIQNKSQIHIFGQQMNCIIEVNNNQIVIARSILY